MTPTEATTLERGTRLRWPSFGSAGRTLYRAGSGRLVRLVDTDRQGNPITPRCAPVDTGAAVIAVPIERLERV